MGLAELLECSARLCPTEECFHVLVVGEIEHGGAVTLGVFVSTMQWGGVCPKDVEDLL